MSSYTANTTPVKSYLGDGVYAWYDGFNIWLHVNDYNNPSDVVCLEPSVMLELIGFNTKCEQFRKELLK